MNFVTQLEDHLRDLGAEARKKHPGVKEASERAILKLRTLQNQYVTAVRKAAADGEKHPSTSMFRSSDLLHPFLLAANYPNASPKLLDTSFKAIRILMEADAICPGDGMNLVRVWMIQAQVVVSYSIKDNNPQINSSRASVSSSGSESVDNSTQSTGSWLGSFLSTSTTSKETGKGTMTVATKAAVSSSHGQAGSGHLNAKDLEKVALDILSCLLQLLELRLVPVSTEQWCQSVALCCLLYLPSKQTIRQAAQSTLPQVLTLLVEDEMTKDLAVATWEDLLACTLGLPHNGSGKRGSSPLKGAFALCRNGEKDAAPPPSSSLSLDLMTTLLREAPFVFSKVGQKTLGVVVLTLQRMTNDESCTAVEYVRILQFVLVVLQTQAKEWPIECLELMARLIAPIPQATEALRSQADFEDGFTYTVHNKTLLPSTATIESLRGVSPTIVWKAALAMDTVKTLVQDRLLMSIWMDSTVLTQLLEAASDFCTIGASCEEHMNLVVLACRKKDHSLIHAAETLNSLDFWKRGKTKDDSYILGEAIWTGFNTILKIIEHLNEGSLEQGFAPSLAVLQHYLKRFPASDTIVHRALQGYFQLAKVSLRFPLIRRALLTSLCKLSLPQWGTQDPTCFLRDNNIAALICLLNIIHRFHDDIGTEWSILMQTFQELSVLHIASPFLSDTAYVGALTISAVFSRFAAFSTCLSDEALTFLVAGLSEVSQFENTPSGIQSPMLGNDLLSVPSKSMDGTSKDDKETIGKTIMNMGVRAIYGSSSDPAALQAEDVPLTERTKNTFSHDYQSEFSRRVVGSKHPVRVNQIPFSFSLLVDLAMTNSFRRGISAATIFRSLCTLASEVPCARCFSMDAVAMLIMSHMEDDFPTSYIGPGKLLYSNPRQNQYLAVEVIENGQGIKGVATQKVLLEPLCECVSTIKQAEVAEAGIEALHAIVESCGHDLDNEAWAIVINAVTSIPSKDRASSEWSNSCLLGFRCLKLIVDDFAALTDPSTAARSALLDCCSSFGSSLHDLNTSLTAIGLLWTIADQDAGTVSIDHALSKLVVLCSDNRVELRNCAVNTLFSCVAGRGRTFSNDQWRACLCDMVFVVFDAVATSMENRSNGSSENTNVMKKSRYKVSIHHSRDSAGKQWVGTQALVLRGLSRVLRNFFAKLLKTTESSLVNLGSENETPWFDDAWNKILAIAFDAATQFGGRDTLDLRTAGTELVVLCAQLSCKQGIQAAITPARVSTNMEVVNGALRTVRSPEKEDGTRELEPHSDSAVTEMWRQNLFLDAFDVLDSFREQLENSDSQSSQHESVQHTLEPTQVQVLSKFADDMRKLYDCCKDDEFREDRSFDEVDSFEILLLKPMSKSNDNDPLVARFVQIMATVAITSSSGPDSRFLSQSQRASIDILRMMAMDGSPQALLVLTELCGSAFFVESADGGKTQKGIDVLEVETSVILQKAFQSEKISDESRLLVLYRLFVGLLEWLGNDDDDNKSKPSYAQMNSVISTGFPAIQNIQQKTTNGGPKAKLLDVFWETVTRATNRVLTPTTTMTDASTSILSIPRAGELVTMVTAISTACPDRFYDKLCTILAEGTSACLKIAKDDSSSSPKKDTLDLFRVCFGAVCEKNPNNPTLLGIADEVLSATSHTMIDFQKTKQNPTAAAAAGGGGDPLEDVNVQACLAICDAMKKVEGSPNFLAITVFPQLCRLVGTELIELRKAVGDVLAKVDLKKFVAESEAMRLAAEERAVAAEVRAEKLLEQIQRLVIEKEALQRRIALI